MMVHTAFNACTDTLRLFVMDTGTTDHICNDKSLFIGALWKVQGITLNGIGGQILVLGIGTVQMVIDDDDGNEHQMMIHNVLYAPRSPAKLSPCSRFVTLQVAKPLIFNPKSTLCQALARLTTLAILFAEMFQKVSQILTLAGPSFR